LHRDVQVPRSTGMCESGHCTGMCRCREAQGKDCSLQSFCISSIPGGQMCESGHCTGMCRCREAQDVRERPWPRTFQSVFPSAFASKLAPTNIFLKPWIAGVALAANIPDRRTSEYRPSSQSKLVPGTVFPGGYRQSPRIASTVSCSAAEVSASAGTGSAVTSSIRDQKRVMSRNGFDIAAPSLRLKKLP